MPMTLKKCPNCGQPTEWKDNPARPFCSERCKLIDFGAWANEEYSVPAEEVPPPLDEVNADADTSDDEAGRRPDF
ncbi:MAG: DNA gyrase inhibitor YacG [Acidobacteria bacterium]|nr:DNA gyrase inhibitor YacG [Acidobacteriota bacterium]